MQFYWRREAEPVKLRLRPSNPQLTPTTLQIQYYYSLIEKYIAKLCKNFVHQKKKTDWLHDDVSFVLDKHT
jgi:hypothetical protein